jgi:uncharacterized protein YjbJ (UPF0337 family)
MTEGDKSGEARQALVDSVKGKAKEVVGAVTGNDSLTAEGQLDQTDAKERREAARTEAEADAEAAQAESLAPTQRRSPRECAARRPRQRTRPRRLGAETRFRSRRRRRWTHSTGLCARRKKNAPKPTLPSTSTPRPSTSIGIP